MSQKIYLYNLHLLFPLILTVWILFQQHVRIHSSCCLWYITVELRLWTTSHISALVEGLQR